MNTRRHEAPIIHLHLVLSKIYAYVQQSRLSAKEAKRNTPSGVF